MTENYEVAKLLVTSHISITKGDVLKEIIPPSINITNRKDVDTYLRQHYLDYYLTTKHAHYFQELTRKELSQLLKLPIGAIPKKYLD